MRDTATGRTVALIVLLILAAAALHGYLPAAERATGEQSGGGRAAMVGSVALLGLSLGIMAVALIHRVRNRRPATGSVGALSAGLGGGGRRPRRRVVAIALALLVVWLLAVWMLTKIVGPPHWDVLPQFPDVPPDAPPTTATAPPGAAPRPEQPHTDGDVSGILSAGAIVLLLFTAIAVGSRLWRGNTAPPAPAGDEPPPAVTAGDRAETFARAAELGLAAVDNPGRDPRAAIIACYAAMEGELAHVPGSVPQAFDTPTEVLARAVENHALSADNASQLVRLFTEARFSQHVMTERHREDAIRILRLVLAELRVTA